MHNCHVVIVAAGSGRRFGSALPKQFCMLAGRPVLMHTIDRMREALPDAGMTVVLSKDMRELWQELCREHAFNSPDIVDGGPSRSASVRNAVLSLQSVPDVVLVHDGARPLVSTGCVREAAEAVHGGVDGAIPAVSVTDSLRLMLPDGRSEAVDRNLYRAVQTPQAFDGAKLTEAYRRCDGDFSDDASIMQHCGHTNIVLTQGEPSNIKITNPIDLEIAELLMARKP
ncbi:MAG: 2-C-methyl-D-erythritol 4-phosphate cytidylyltransferase [Muribaculaceae bacterium]|nr:2-C-methyl-D-erythritol 4-phosphate cytidylyltransferase [Muribaculaceae bacterium]